MANVIEQIVQPKSFGTQTIEMNVRSNERGPQGEKGDTGDAATINAGNAYSIDYGQQPVVMNSGTSSNATFDFYIPKGEPGAIHYTAGPGINITADNRIEATGEVAVYWGDLVGSMSNQTDLTNALNSKQPKLTAGTNITISNNTISAKEYTAGNGLDLNDGEFSVDTDEIQPKLTAGSNIQINSNTISATDTTYNDFIGADGDYGGSAGLVPAPIATDNVNVLKGDGSWGKVNSSNVDKMSLIDLFYPVGSYYETSNTSFDPNVSWGGTWEEDTAGRVLVAQDNGTFSTVGDTGGSETHVHTVVAGIRTFYSSGMLETTNGLYIKDENGNYSTNTSGTLLSAESSKRNSGLQSNVTTFNHDGFAVQATGSTYSASGLQPYTVIKRWHRTA